MNQPTASTVAAFRRRYGASPLHLLLTLACFALALYAGIRLLKGDTLGVVIWFVGAALLHDLVLLPAYSVTDRAAQALLGSPPAEDGGRRRPSVNHLRVPAFVAGVLFLVWWPLILQRGGHYTASTGLSADGFLARWLLITAGLFLASALVLLVRTWLRLRPERRAARAARARAQARKATE
ncbi:hypothetical protein [Streptomyces sp. NPDC002104]